MRSFGDVIVRICGPHKKKSEYSLFFVLGLIAAVYYDYCQQNQGYDAKLYRKYDYSKLSCST